MILTFTHTTFGSHQFQNRQQTLLSDLVFHKNDYNEDKRSKRNSNDLKEEKLPFFIDSSSWFT